MYPAPKWFPGNGGSPVQSQVLEKVLTTELQTHPEEQGVGEETHHHHTHQQGQWRSLFGSKSSIQNIQTELSCVFVTVLCAGSGGQRCTSRAGGCGTGTAEDWTAVSWRLAVGSGPMPLLRWHLFTWRCVYWLMRISNKSGKMLPWFSIFHSINSILCIFCIHQVRTTAPRFGRAPTRAVCMPTLWKCLV